MNSTKQPMQNSFRLNAGERYTCACCDRQRGNNRTKEKVQWRKEQMGSGPLALKVQGATGLVDSQWCWCDEHKADCDGSCQFGWDDCPRCLAPFVVSLEHNRDVCTYSPC